MVVKNSTGRIQGLKIALRGASSVVVDGIMLQSDRVGWWLLRLRFDSKEPEACNAHVPVLLEGRDLQAGPRRLLVKSWRRTLRDP